MRSNRSEKVGDQGGDAAGVGFVGFTEVRAHPLFFETQFAQEGEEDEGDGKQPAPLANGYGRTKKSEQQAGIDGMANQGVGAGGDEFVILLHGDGSAPVSTQLTAGPDGEEQTAGGNCRAGPEAPLARGEKALVENGDRNALRPEKHQGTHNQNKASKA